MLMHLALVIVCVHCECAMYLCHQMPTNHLWYCVLVMYRCDLLTGKIVHCSAVVVKQVENSHVVIYAW